jgi:uncharacterized protein with ParB-like and HNH nuclease domain
MDALKKSILDFIGSNESVFLIPVYQRDYTWKKANCEKLWLDLLNLIKNERESHFFGSIVEINNGRDKKGYAKNLIIDGQQRLTTISILLIAMRNYLKNNPKDNEISCTRIEQYLTNVDGKDDVRIRLKPNKQDKKHFEELFENKDIDKEAITSNILLNYAFFYDKLKQNNISSSLFIDDLFTSLKKLEIVLVTLTKPKDDPQLIFESLNSTGVDLTASDLIRNYILMDLEPEEQETQYEKFWLKIEELTNQDISEFIRHYLCFHFKSSIKKASIYNDFQKFKEKSNLNKSQLLEKLLKYAQTYSYFINNHPDPEIENGLQRIRDLDSTILYPYLFDVFDLFENETLKKNDILAIIKTIESYIFRKSLQGDTKGMQGMLILLASDIKKHERWKTNYLEIFNAILISKNGAQRFPDDEDFIKNLRYSQIYKMRSCKLLLSSIENFESPYKVDLEGLQIEHIMPQKISGSEGMKWKKMLGEKWQDIHTKYLHTIGNLSLVSSAKNKESSNNNYESKQDIDYKLSKLKLSRHLSRDEIWNEDKIKERAGWMIETVKKIWSYPQSSYKINKESDDNIFILQEFENEIVTGYKPFLIEIKNKTIETKSWKDLMVELLRIFNDYSPTDFRHISDMKPFERLFCSGKYKGISISEDIIPGYKIETNHSASATVTTLQKICKEMNFEDEILIYIKSSKNDK